MSSGCLQWGYIGSGIEHGAKFDKAYTGPVHGFQLWVNLPSKNKMDPPCFQDAEPAALPVVQLSEKARAKVLVGELLGAASPIDTGAVHVQYVDFTLETGASFSHALPDGFTTVFVYVYGGQGRVCGEPCRRGDILKLEACGLVVMSADADDFGMLLLSGIPLKEKIVQHGPFVMSSNQQIQQAFRDYQSGRFLNETCEYVLHKAGGTERSQRSLC